MSEDYLIRNCAPTLAGLKTGSLFACPYDSREGLTRFLRDLNRRLGPKGVCHKLKRLGDIDFLIDTLQSNEIRSYYDKKWYPESLYLLAMVDYLSRMNGIALCRDYDDIRKRKLSDILFPSGVLALAASCGNATAKQQAIANAIPEFLRFNIVESEIRNVN